MGLGGCYSFVKCILMLLNIVFGVVGVVAVGVAVWMSVDSTFYVSMTQDQPNYLGSICILFIAGILLVIVSMVGCLGTLRESKCLLITFFSILLVVLVAEIAAGIWCYIHADNLEKFIQDSVRETVQKDYYENQNRREVFDAIQNGLECCGADKPSDWVGNNQKILPLSITSDPSMFDIPKSCCRSDVSDKDCEQATKGLKVGSKINSRIIFENGCALRLVEVLKKYSNVFFGVGITIIIVELLALIFALIIAFSINKSARYKS